jgi:hypothetical protein
MRVLDGQGRVHYVPDHVWVEWDDIRVAYP